MRGLRCFSAVCLWFVVRSATSHAADYPLEPLSVAETRTAFEVVQARFKTDPALWMTRFRDNEQYAAGLFPNRAKDGSGVDQFTTPAESLNGQDVVL